jgi:hypothetical protein
MLLQIVFSLSAWKKSGEPFTREPVVSLNVKDELLKQQVSFDELFQETVRK